ncbi:Rrf2 family transcriptional regulator [Glaciihabitans sp. UYNi722]|uniref:RrF2 family transcriptional regulator n=1 Tax=Glaciihabitans sp. UYNi722 TaxID=3156344 RepID=UPI00339A212F
MELPRIAEWALHCCWLLAQTEEGRPLPRRKLSEFFDLPEAYLAKVLAMLTSAELLMSTPGARGGYRLARPAGEITALQIVQAVDGRHTFFHCAEIRQRGPVGLTAEQCTRPCGIARVMHEAELAYRDQLALTTLSDLIGGAPPASQQRAASWLGDDARSEIRTTSRLPAV